MIKVTIQFDNGEIKCIKNVNKVETFLAFNIFDNTVDIYPNGKRKIRIQEYKIRTLTIEEDK